MRDRVRALKMMGFEGDHAAYLVQAGFRSWPGTDPGNSIQKKSFLRENDGLAGTSVMGPGTHATMDEFLFEGEPRHDRAIWMSLLYDGPDAIAVWEDSS